jgi:hypothetical protein
MKVSFKNIMIQPTLKGEAQAQDLTDIIAEAVYQNAVNFNEHKLAHRISEGGDEIELTPEEAGVVKRAVSQWRFFVQKPILEALGENFK